MCHGDGMCQTETRKIEGGQRSALATIPPVKGALAGKCIHGNAGARMERGRLVNPGCEWCLVDNFFMR